MQPKTLKASKEAFSQIRQTLQEIQEDTGWEIKSDEWLKYAAKLNDSSWTEDDEYPKGFSLPTWIRFTSGYKGQPLAINAKAFKIFCKVLGLKWEDVVEKNSIENIAEKNNTKELARLADVYYEEKNYQEALKFLEQGLETIGNEIIALREIIYKFKL